MTIPLWCLTFSMLIPYLIAGSTGPFRKKQFGILDNKNPRRQQRDLEGMGARLVGAQANTWEALLVFTAAVLIAHVTGADPQGSAIAALVWVGARVVYPLAYVFNIDKLRSLSWLVGILACAYLVYLSAAA